MEIIKTKYIFSENNQVLIKASENDDEWYPINFQWIPVKKLTDSMNQ